jgi:hypothetical protein
MRAWPQRSSASESLHFAAGHYRRRPIIMATSAMTANFLKEADWTLLRLRCTAEPAHSSGDLSARLAAVTPARG